MLVEAGSSYFVSVINCCHFRLKYYKVFFTNTKMAHPCHMVKGFGLAHYFPADCVFNVLVLQVPNVLGQTGGIFGVPGFKARFVVSSPVFKGG